MNRASPPSKPLGFGVLGCADIAWRRTVPALLAHPGVRLVASASRTPDKARRFADRFGGEALTGYGQLLARPDVDAVYLPLPAMLQAHWIGLALDAGKHVFAEKPLSADRADTERLFRTARERGLVLRENTMFLHHSQHAAVTRLVEDGAIGELRGFSSTFTIPPRPPEDIRNRADLGGGALLDIAFYPVRAALRFLGHELRVAGATLRTEKEGVVRSGSALLVTPDGVPAQLAFGMEHSYRSEYAIFGSGGSLSLDRAFTPAADWRPSLHLCRGNAREVIALPSDDQFANIVDAFVTSVAALAPGAPGASADHIAAEANSIQTAGLIDEVAAVAVRTDV
ncbi:Gfo/Idh/MocA family protein [Streptomyces sp. NPDC087850]|uniref:Gfo/Idh/MocA family protein n=1 Tax=unclassified Streptomyces TaxID=2593676 RepID=UPI00380AA0F9